MSAAHELDDGEVHDLCPVMEVPRNECWCWYCQQIDRLAQHGDSNTRTSNVTSRAPATQDGYCGGCGEYYEAGDTVGITRDGNYLCEGCP